MGGFGSGRHGGKSVTGDMFALDIRKIQRAEALQAGLYFNWQWTRGGKPVANINIQIGTDRVTLIYKSRSNGGEWKDKSYPVYLSWTPCNYGGQRAWWLCPAVGCRRRVAVLYGGSVYACRHCHKLAYRTQRENAGDRAGSKADKLRDRLGWEAGILNGNGGKPKGMHWRTFEQLQARHDANVNQSLACVMARFKGLADKING
jgi:hypothetical protein